jgi:hypothetical protein
MKKIFAMIFFAFSGLNVLNAQEFAEISTPKEMRIYRPCKTAKLNGKKLPKKYIFACNNKTSILDIKAPSGRLFVRFDDPGYKYFYLFFRLENRTSKSIDFDQKRDIKLYAVERDGTERLLNIFTNSGIEEEKNTDTNLEKNLEAGGLKPGKIKLLQTPAEIAPSQEITGGVFFDRHIAHKYKLVINKGDDSYELIFALLNGFKKGYEKIFNNPTNVETIYIYR